MQTEHALRVLSDLIAGSGTPQPGVQLATGTMTAVSGDKTTATVDLYGSSVLASLPHGYVPTVGDTVRLLVQGHQVVVMGASVGSTAVEQGTASPSQSGAPALYIGPALPSVRAPRYLWVKFFLDVNGNPAVDLIVEDGT